jgi:hypothetical protein
MKRSIDKVDDISKDMSLKKSFVQRKQDFKETMECFECTKECTVIIKDDKSLPFCKKCKRRNNKDSVQEEFYDMRCQEYGPIGENFNSPNELALLYKKYKLRQGVFTEFDVNFKQFEYSLQFISAFDNVFNPCEEYKSVFPIEHIKKHWKKWDFDSLDYDGDAHDNNETFRQYLDSL